jgi:hypothetical protein
LLNKLSIINKMTKTATSSKTQPKRTKIVVGINSLCNTSYAAYTNHIQLFYNLGRKYNNLDICLWNPQRMSIDRMRNSAADTALDIEADYLLFIDDDVIIPHPFDFLEKLIACDADIACGDVLIRGYPFNHMIFRYNKDKTGLVPMPKIPKKLGPIPVDAVGFSLCLIRTEVLRQIPRPWFVTGISNTEDIYFCLKVRDKFPDARIICDTSIRCGHILWNEIIESGNKKAYTKYWEETNGKPQEDPQDRGNSYYNIVRAR